MIVHQIFAQICANDIKNIMVCDNYELANQLSRSIFGESAYAVECTQYAVSIGDKYQEGKFYFKDGVTLVPRQNTAEENEKLLLVQAKQLELNQSELLVDTDYRLSLLELGL